MFCYFLLFNVSMIAWVNGIPNNNCNVTKTKLQICEGSDTSYPSTYHYGQKSLEVKPILTLLNFAKFDPEEKTATVFVSLMLEWNDTRLSLNSYE